VRRRGLLQSTRWLQLRESAYTDDQEAVHDGDAGAGEPKVHGRHEVREKSWLRRHQRVQRIRGRVQQQ